MNNRERCKVYRDTHKDKIKIKRQSRSDHHKQIRKIYTQKNASNLAVKRKQYLLTTDGFLRKVFSSCHRSKHGCSIVFGDLQELWIKQNGKCAVSGLSMTTGNDVFNMTKISLDRIDSTKGYDIDNIRLVCWWVNLAKWRLDNEEFVNWCIIVAKANNYGN